jgi:hypothetical protein
MRTEIPTTSLLTSCRGIASFLAFNMVDELIKSIPNDLAFMLVPCPSADEENAPKARTKSCPLAVR